MDIAYWIIGGLLAAFYLYSGGIKLVQSQEQLSGMMPWAGTSVPMSGVRALGTLELAAALGLVLPPLTGVAPGLAVAAAFGLAILQVAALLFHVRRGDRGALWLNVSLTAVAIASGVLALASDF